MEKYGADVEQERNSVTGGTKDPNKDKVKKGAAHGGSKKKEDPKAR